MSLDISVVLETILGSALGAGATFIGIWFLFFKARIEHLQAISAPNLAKELQGVSQMLDQSAKEKKELEQKLVDDFKKRLPEILKGPLDTAMEYSRMTGIVTGGWEAMQGLIGILQSYSSAVEMGKEPPISDAMMSRIKNYKDGLKKSMADNLAGSQLKGSNLLLWFKELEKL